MNTTQWRILLNVCGSSCGDFRRHVWLVNDCKDGQTVRLPVRYRVVPEVYAEPGFVALGLLGDAPVTAEVLIRTVADSPVQLLGAVCDHPLVDVELVDPVTSVAQPARLRIQVQGPWPPGDVDGVLELQAASDQVPWLRIPLRGTAVAGLACDSREILFPDVRLGTTASQTVTFTGPRAGEIGAVRAAGEAVTVASVERSGAGVQVTVRTAPQLPLGEFRGHLVLELNADARRAVRLPYRGRVVEASTGGLTAPAAVPAGTAPRP